MARVCCPGASSSDLSDTDGPACDKRQKKPAPGGRFLSFHRARKSCRKALTESRFDPSTIRTSSSLALSYCRSRSQGRRRIDVPCAASVEGPRTSTFCNPLRHNTMQNNLGIQKDTKVPCSRSVVPFFSFRFLADARNDIPCHHRRSSSLVTIDAAGFLSS